MYLSITPELSRGHREEIMQTIAQDRLSRTHAKGETTYGPVRNLRWELSRYAGLFGMRVRK